MHVAVCIVGYNNAADIVGCLNALGASTYADFEVVICENGGAAAFAALLAATPQALPRDQPVKLYDAGSNLGYAGGVNNCIRLSPEADAWWVLNPDTEPHPDAMAHQVARLRRGDCDAVGCTINMPDRIQSHGGRWSPWLARAVSLGHSTPLGSVVSPEWVEEQQNYLNGASMMVSRRFVERVGLMREEYFLYCEEVEWFLRAGQRGLRLGYASQALVLHQCGTTTGSGEALRSRPKLSIYLNERNRLLVTRDRFPARLPAVALGALLVAIARFSRQRAWRQLGYAVQGWFHGLLGRRGRPTWY